MQKKKLVRLVFILIPAVVLILQIFIPYSPQLGRPERVKKAVQKLIPPMELIFRYFDFNQKNALLAWDQKVFQGHSAYWIDFKNGSGFVHSKSKGSASAIFYKLKYDVSKYPNLSWKWRIKKFPDKSKATDIKSRDDFAARVYVVFLTGFFTNLRCVEYVWDETLPEGTNLDSPFTGKIKQTVIQSGLSPDAWVSESRNVLQDYEKLFGEKPKMKVAAIAIMTDSEGTGGEDEAFFDDIQIGKSDEKP